MNTVDFILAYHRGRNPRLLALKWDKIRESPFAFFRGTAPLFYEGWARRKLPAAPAVWICGDAHLENVGSYKGDNRVPYFDLNDFDEACLAPVHWEIGRALTGLYLLGQPARARRFLAAYRERLLTGKPQHIEPEVARGPIATLLANVQVRRRKEFLAPRLIRGKLRIKEGRTYAIDAATRRRVRQIFQAWARRQPDPGFYRIEDICGRIAGNGSLGVERFVVLVRGKRLPSLMDMKQAVPDAPRQWLKVRQPRWENEAERVATVQNFMQYVPVAHLGWTRTQPVAYLLRELQPVEDRLDLGMLTAADYDDFADQWAGLIASAHLRSGGWNGSAPIGDLMGYARTLTGSHARRLQEAARQMALQQKRQFMDFRRYATKRKTTV
ncbi:DUF2252 family protein [Opitutus sp. GAS368]|jgi:uncharacterized protein (DUF2252 family)|uniref:DUF2252 family protein n=1 Tax=Opitutus sp. GAS368 TaxID=1882749 RepID=UPI00087CDF3D|nr:DUF2252 family protein [Opitutus sp. GAS368]SDR67184.1 Uncharacterized conserved protein, DUF2252 family [Opitutus sp. GAS368]